jgi:multiple sugar transport system substrate-binding protein
MRLARTAKLLAVGLLSAGLVTLSACGAGSRTGANTATQVACAFENPTRADDRERAGLQLLGR